jgi:hypothetical protein
MSSPFSGIQKTFFRRQTDEELIPALRIHLLRESIGVLLKWRKMEIKKIPITKINACSQGEIKIRGN